MNNRVPSTRTRRGCAELPQAPAERRKSLRRESPVGGARYATVQSTKRRLDATPEIDSLPAKRARLSRTGTQQHEIENEKLGQDEHTAHKQPQSNAPYASFLKVLADPADPYSCPESINTFVSKWLESVGPDRETYCQSDNHRHSPDDSPISRSLTRSVLEMERTRDNESYVVPSTASTWLVALSDSMPTSNQSYSRNPINDPHYKSVNLTENNIYMRNSYDKFPEHITELIDYVRQGRESPPPSPDQLRHSADLQQLNYDAAEAEVESYFRKHMFYDVEKSESLKQSLRQPMAKQTVPSSPSKPKLSIPVPDLLYGYNHDAAFPQQAQLISIGLRTLFANNQQLIYPFFAIEFKGEGGSMRVATNQCIGASISCVNMAERLNDLLKGSKNDEIQPINSAAFSVAINGSEARLFISWRDHELQYQMQQIDSFLLQRPTDYLEFRKYVRNIVDWGKGQRLDEIRHSLDSLQEDRRKTDSKAAKSREPPTNDSALGMRKKHKT